VFFCAVFYTFSGTAERTALLKRSGTSDFFLSLSFADPVVQTFPASFLSLDFLFYDLSMKLPTQRM